MISNLGTQIATQVAVSSMGRRRGLSGGYSDENKNDNNDNNDEDDDFLFWFVLGLGIIIFGFM